MEGSTPTLPPPPSPPRAKRKVSFDLPDKTPSKVDPLCEKLFEASEKGILEDLKEISTQIGMDSDLVNFRNPEMWSCTPLYAAAMNGETQVVDFLLQFTKIDVNLATDHGWTPISTASYNNHPECLRLLVAHPTADVNKTTNNGCSPVSWACASGNIECLKILISQPSLQINLAEEDGATPLFRACQNGHTEAVKVCLQHPDIDIKKPNKEGKEPIQVAKKREIVALLRTNRTEMPPGGCCLIM